MENLGFNPELYLEENDEEAENKEKPENSEPTQEDEPELEPETEQQRLEPEPSEIEQLETAIENTENLREKIWEEEKEYLAFKKPGVKLTEEQEKRYQELEKVWGNPNQAEKKEEILDQELPEAIRRYESEKDFLLLKERIESGEELNENELEKFKELKTIWEEKVPPEKKEEIKKAIEEVKEEIKEEIEKGPLEAKEVAEKAKETLNKLTVKEKAALIGSFSLNLFLIAWLLTFMAVEKLAKVKVDTGGKKK